MKFWKRNRAPLAPKPGGVWPALLAAIGESTSDRMLVAGPEDGGSVCTDWVGAVLSVSGADKNFPALVDAIEDGLFHRECRHKLLPYLPEEGEAEALFCTRLALTALIRRRDQRERAGDPSRAAIGEGPRAEFMRWYEQARDAEKASPPERALEHCQEALAVLTRHDVFGDDHLMIARVLKGRMQTILRAQQRPEARVAPVA